MQCQHIPKACWKLETEPSKTQEETYLVAVLCRIREKMGTISGNNNSSFIGIKYLWKFNARAIIVATRDHASISVAEQSLDWMSYWQEKRLGARTADLISDLVLCVFCIFSIISSFI
jgi:hypothetical protein